MLELSSKYSPAWEQIEGAELVALCDIRPEQMEKYPNKRHYTDLDEMLEKEQLDILDICVPTYLHVPFAAKALERGISAISEKPLSLDPEDAIQGTYIYDGFYVTAEAGWYIGQYPFSAGFRVQFDEAVLEYRKGNFLLYKKDGSCVLNLLQEG